ncbi:MAG: Gfo/Idh/MocA family protein [Blastopirellula sp. JB062]
MKTSLSLLLCLGLACLFAGNAVAEPLRIGLIGLDSSHAVAFTKKINADDAPADFAGAKVVAAFPGGSPDLPSSADRIEGFTKQISDMGIEIVPSIDALLKKVDAVIMNSVDGRVHLAQAKPVLEAGLPLFVDKPVTASMAEAKELFALSKKTGTPCFSCSTLRYCDQVVELQKANAAGEIVGCVAYSPCKLDPTHPDFFWYGIHGVETLFTVMGPGCVSVQRTQVDGVELATGVWKDGRVGTFRGIRDGKAGYGVVVFGKKKTELVPIRASYDTLVGEIVKFFHTKKPPVSPEETLEIVAFMTAADISRDAGGKSVTLKSVLQGDQ